MKKMKLDIQHFSIPYNTYIEFEDLPSTETPVSASNLNIMQDSIHNDIADKSIVESGSNANSGYIKFGDGTLVCYGKKTFLFGFTDPAPAVGGYASGTLALDDFPSAFLNTPYITGSVTKAAGQWAGWWSGAFTATSNTNPGSVEFYRTTSTSTDVVTYTINYIAIGKWNQEV